MSLLSKERIMELRHHHPRHLRPTLHEEPKIKPTHRTGPSKARDLSTYRGYRRQKGNWFYYSEITPRYEPYYNLGKIYPSNGEREVNRRKKQMEG